jgi:hypothetical protein
MYSQGVFDVWYECPHCGYRSWARAYGVGEGMDTGIQKSASAKVALDQAHVMAEHAASRAVHGSPCPKCGQHHPDIVRWAMLADREQTKRIQMRKMARILRVVGLSASVLFVVCFATMRMPLENWILLVLTAGGSLLASRILFASSEPIHNRWMLYKRTAPGVTFLPGAEDPAKPSQ